jgi:hypothetical protein
MILGKLLVAIIVSSWGIWFSGTLGTATKAVPEAEIPAFQPNWEVVDVTGVA